MENKVVWELKLSKLSITKNVLLKWYSVMKKWFKKILIIFDMRNWLWKSEFFNFWQLLFNCLQDFLSNRLVDGFGPKERPVSSDGFELEFSGSSEPELWSFRAESSRAGALQFSSWNRAEIFLRTTIKFPKFYQYHDYNQLHDNL